MFDVSVAGAGQAVAMVAALAGLGGMIWQTRMSAQREGEPQVRWSWLPFLGWALEMGQRPIELLQESADKYGEIFGLIIAGNRMFFINDPHSAHILFRATKDLSWEEFHHTIIHAFFGGSMKTLQARLLDEDLMRKWYHVYIYGDAKLFHLTLRLQKRLNTDCDKVSASQVPMYKFLGKLILKASIASLFNDAAADDEALYDAFMEFDKMLPICAAGINLKNFSQAHKARQVLLDSVAKHFDDNSELIQVRRQHFKEVGIPDDDATCLQLAMFWASVGNTMPTTFWLFYYLMCQPDLMLQAKKEVQEAFAANPPGSRELSQEQLNNMVFIDACITETMRLISGSLLMRYVKRPCELTLNSGNTYRFRKGDRIGMCPALIHNDNEIYPDAKSFVPSRWLQGATQEEKIAGSQGKMPMFKGGKEIPAGSSFLPFGYGATYCPGRRFARNEMKTLVALLLSRFDFSFPQMDSATGKPLVEPVFDCSRAGVGIFPPKDDILVNIAVAK